MTTPLTPVIYLMFGVGVGTSVGALIGCVLAFMAQANVGTPIIQYWALIGLVAGSICGYISYELRAYNERKETEE